MTTLDRCKFTWMAATHETIAGSDVYLQPALCFGTIKVSGLLLMPGEELGEFVRCGTCHFLVEPTGNIGNTDALFAALVPIENLRSEKI